MADSISEQQAFFKIWNARYPETPPVGYLFKHHLPRRWARIHNLPGSKRYAETADEWACLLYRQNTVIDDLAGPGTPLTVVINAYKEDNPLLKSEHAIFVGRYSAGDGEFEYPCYHYQTTWQPQEQERILRLIANDDMRAFYIAPDCLIAPYDGGVDLILKDEAALGVFKQKYRKWLSTREDGL